MWEIVVTFLLHREPVWQIKTHAPPALGDRVELSNGTFVVASRVWKRSYTEQKLLDVVLEEIDEGKKEDGTASAGRDAPGAGSRGTGAGRGRARGRSAR